MTVNAESLRHLADVVDELQEAPIDVDGARVLNATDDELRAQVALTIPMDATPEIDTERDDPESDQDEFVCDVAGCEFTTQSKRGLAIHKGRAHTEAEAESDTATEDDTTESLSEARPVDLEADVADDAPETDGDDVQDETEIEAEDVSVDPIDDRVTCDGCGETFNSDEALQGHGPRNCSSGDTPDVKLPDGVTADDVRVAADEHETLGDVGQEIGVTRGRARTITVALGCYGDVRDVPARDRATLTPLQTVALGVIAALTFWTLLAFYGVIL